MDRVGMEFGVFHSFFHLIHGDISSQIWENTFINYVMGITIRHASLHQFSLLLSNVSSISGVHGSSLMLVNTLSSSSSSSVLLWSSELLVSSLLLWLADASAPWSISAEGSSITELSSSLSAHGWTTVLWRSMLYLLVNSLPQSGHSTIFDVYSPAFKHQLSLGCHWKFDIGLRAHATWSNQHDTMSNQHATLSN